MLRAPRVLRRHAQPFPAALTSIRWGYTPGRAPLHFPLARTIYFPPSSDPPEVTAFRSRLESASSDVDAAVAAFVQSRQEYDIRFTFYQASQLLAALVKHKRLEECEQLWDDCRNRGWTLYPSTCAAVFQALVSEGKYDQALQRLQLMQHDGLELEPWVYGLALNAAVKTQRLDVVEDIVKLWGIDVPAFDKADEELLCFLQELQDRGEKLSEFALQMLDSFAQRTDADTAMVVWSLMRIAEAKPTLRFYTSAIHASARQKRWRDAVNLYEDMPEELRLRLSEVPLAIVATAREHVETRDLMLRSVEMFKQVEPPTKKFDYAAALVEQLEGCQYEAVLALAEDMKRQGVRPTQPALEAVILAHIRSGSAEEARRLLQTKRDLLIDTSKCYRELISHYVNTEKDMQLAGETCMEMVENNSVWLSLSDWRDACELTLQLPDSSLYRKVRASMVLKAPSIDAELPIYFTFARPGRSQSLKPTRVVTQTSAASPSNALELVEQIQHTEGLRLSPSVASVLLRALAKHNYAAECVKVLDYCREEGIAFRATDYVAALQYLYSGGHFQKTLQLYEAMLQNGWNRKPTVDEMALDAAIQTHQHKLIASVFKRLVNEFGGSIVFPTEGDLATDMLRVLCEYGPKLPDAVLRPVAAFAKQSRLSDLALEVLYVASARTMEPMTDVYEAAIIACGADRRWDDVINVYNDIPESERASLDNLSLSMVMQAHVRSDSDELKLQGMEIFDKYKYRLNQFTWNAAMEVHLDTRDFEALFALADEMKLQGLEGDAYTNKLIVLAHIRRGSVETAKQLLRSNRQIQRLACYRELIAHYTDTCRDPQEACELYVEMIRNNRRMLDSQWHDALKLSMELPDKSMYRKLRRLMAIKAPSLSKTLPPHLILPRQRKPQASSVSRSAATDPAQAFKIARSMRHITPTLSSSVASMLLETLTKQDYVDECVKVLDYCYEQGVRLKPFAQIAGLGGCGVLERSK